MTAEHKSDTVTVKVQRGPNCKVTLETLASSSLVAQARKEAVRKVAKTVSIPGFRKGKAPENLILKSFGNAVKEEWEKLTANKAFQDVQNLVKMPLLNGNAQITFDMKKHCIDQGAEMTFTFETEPELPNFDFSKLTLEQTKRPEISDKQVDETIKQICSYFGKVERITDRPAKEGDTVHIDVNLVKGDEVTPVFTNQRFEMRESKMAKWMRDLVSGMKVGESKDGVSQPDESATEEEKKEFQPKDVRVSLISIEQVELPEFDAEIAKKLGVESVEEAKKRVKALLEKQVENDKKSELRVQVSEKLINEFPFAVPESSIAREAEHRLGMRQKNADFRRRWAKMTEEERTQERVEIAEEAEKAIRLFYVCRKIAQENGLRVSRDDLKQNITSTLDAMFADPQLMNLQEGSEQESVALSRIMLNKAQDFVAAQCTITERKPGSQKKAAPKKTAAKKPAAEKSAAEKKAPEKKAKAPAKKPAAKKADSEKKPAAKKAAPKKTAAKKTATTKKST